MITNAKLTRISATCGCHLIPRGIMNHNMYQLAHIFTRHHTRSLLVVREYPLPAPKRRSGRFHT